MHPLKSLTIPRVLGSAILLLALPSCSSTKAMINRAQGTVEKHGVAAPVSVKPNPWLYGLVPVMLAVDIVLSPFQIKEWMDDKGDQ